MLLTLHEDSLEGLKGKLETFERALGSKGLRRVTKEETFPSGICKNGLSSTSLLFQFCRCWVYNYVVLLELKEDSKFPCHLLSSPE